MGSPNSLTTALKWVLDEMAQELAPLAITGVRRHGRAVRVTVRERKEAITGDRLALLTLVRDLWGEEAFGFKLPRYLVQEQAFLEYVAQIAEGSRAEARALYVHINGADELPLPRGHRLAALFPKPLFATRGLAEAASGGAMIRRALDHAKKGSLVDRLAAIHTIDLAVPDAAHHNKAREILASVEDLAMRLSQSKSPLLKEAGWLLHRKCSQTIENMAAWARGTWLK